MLDWNSASHITFYDPTTTALPTGFEETTAPSGNLASAMRNWVLEIEQPGAVERYLAPVPDTEAPETNTATYPSRKAGL